MKPLKTLLVFPPQWVPTQPPLGLPSLTAYLRTNGYNVTQKDVNIELYNTFLSKDYLEGMHERLSTQFDQMDSKEKLSIRAEQTYYNSLFIAKSIAFDVAERIEEAKRVFRSEDFYDIRELAESRKTIRKAFAIISTAFYPTTIEFSGFEMQRLHESINGINKATQNRQENPFIELYEKQTLPYIHKLDPDLIGISIIGGTQIIPGLTLARLIKNAGCNAHIVIGGSIFTQLINQVTKMKDLFTNYFDSIIPFEGERPLLDLVKQLDEKREFEKVPNLIYDDGKKICKNEVLPAEDINSLPPPDYDDLPFNLYYTPKPVLSILSSRGCYWGKCAFCFHGLIYQGGYQRRDTKKVIDDIESLSKKYGISHFAFSDECISPQNFSDISDEILERGLNIRCLASGRFDPQLTEELCARIGKAGFKTLYFGLESGNMRVLNHMKKGIDTQTVLDVCRNVTKANIWNHLFTFMGFPTETAEEAQETVDFLLAHQDIIKSFSIAFFHLGIGADVMNYPEKYGISKIDLDPDKELKFVFDYEVVSGLKQLEAEKKSIDYMEKIVNEFETSRILANLGYDNLLLYFSHYENSDPYLESVRLEPQTTLEETEYRDSGQINRQTIPSLKKGVILNTLKFNISEIQSNIMKTNNIVVYPKKTDIIYNPQNTKLNTVTQVAKKILELSDGKINISTIAQNLANHYSIPSQNIEKDCISFLKTMRKEGFIEI